MTKEYREALAQAEANLADARERGQDASGEDVLAFMDTLLTPEEIAESNLKISLMGELIKARQEKGISQKKLEEMSGVKQPVIARAERGVNCPTVNTMLKILLPLGKTLAIVPLEAQA